MTIEEALNTIKSECAANNDDCISCPFNIKDSWHEYCLFMGCIPHEGTIPEFWELDKIKWKKRKEMQNDKI